MTTPKSYDVQRCFQSEQASVGSCIILSSMVSQIRHYLSPSRFYHSHLGDIFGAICILEDSKSPIDIISVSEMLRKQNKFDLVGGGEFLAETINSVAFADHGEYYAKVAATYYYEREIISLANDLVLSAADSSSREKSCAEYLELIRQAVLERDQIGLPAEFDYANDLYDLLDTLLKKRVGYKFDIGFPSLDLTLGGLTPGEVITWGAAPNVGKSLMLLNIASHCLLQSQSVLYVGTEMSARETAGRHLAILSCVDPQKVRNNTVSREEVDRMNSTLSDRMIRMKMKIIDLPEPSLHDIESSLSRTRSQVVFIDYLQRLKLPPGDNYRLQVNDFMRQLKNLARRYNVVIHLASQLSRSAYSGEEQRPMLSHLSESSGIEKESDRVGLIWCPKDKQNDKNNPLPANTQLLEVILAKNRHGKKGLALDLYLDETSLRLSELMPSTLAPEVYP